MFKAADKYRTGLICLALTVITLAVFWQVHTFEFVNYDDNAYVSENAHIYSGFTANNIKWLFTKDIGSWHPLTGLTHMMDCGLFGLNAGRHHLTNLLLHIANTLLLFALLRRMTGAIWQSAFVAALFAVHPLHVESVAWISGRKDVLSTLFWLLTITVYFSYVKKPTAGRYIFVLVLFALGLMAKPMLITLPFVLLLFDYWPLSRFEAKGFWPLILEKIPFFALSVVSSIATFLIQRSMGAVRINETLALTVRAGNAVVSYEKYILQMIWPTHLAVFYPYPVNKLSYWQIFITTVLLVTITIFVIRFAARYRYLPVGWFWYLGTLAPVSGIIQVGDHAMADRYTYVSLIGLFIIIAWGAGDLSAEWKHRRAILSLSSFAVILILAVCSAIQASCWHDSISLFDHALNVTSGNYVAYNNRGVAYEDKGDFDRAISDYNKAIEIDPKYARAYNNRGSAYFSQHKLALAVSDFTKAIEIKPGFEIYINSGKAYEAMGQYDLAVSDYSKAIEIDPSVINTYINRGIAYKNTGQYDLAVSDFNKALNIDPKCAEACNNRGTIYDAKGQLDTAILDYDKALEINPGYVQAYCNRGTAYGRKGQYDLAVSDYDKALKINPKYADAYFNKAIICENAGRKTEAIEAYKAFLRYAPAPQKTYVERARQKIRDLEK